MSREKKWKPKVGEKYWYISAQGTLWNGKFINSDWDCEHRYNFGNCFRTNREAQFALSRVKKVLGDG